MLLKPISDASIGSWTTGSGGTTNLYEAVNNIPPAGLSNASMTNTSQIINSSTDASYYIANLETYSSAGITNDSHVINGVHVAIAHARNATTNALAGSNYVWFNPQNILGSTFNYGNSTANAAGTIGSATGWAGPGTTNRVAGAPSDLTVSPQIRVNKTTALTDTASICFLGLYVSVQDANYRDFRLVGEAPSSVATDFRVNGTASATTRDIRVTGSGQNYPEIPFRVTGTPLGVQLIGTTQATGNSITLPTHQPGDWIVMAVGRTGSTSLPTVPTAGGTVPAWTTRVSGGTDSTAIRLVTFEATASNHTSGTWTNATNMIAAVFRSGSPDGYLKLGYSTGTGQTAQTFYTQPTYESYGAESGLSQVITAVIRSVATSDIANAPTNMVNRVVEPAAPNGVLALHTRAGGHASVSQNVNVTGSGGSRTATLEIVQVPVPHDLQTGWWDGNVATAATSISPSAGTYARNFVYGQAVFSALTVSGTTDPTIVPPSGWTQIGPTLVNADGLGTVCALYYLADPIQYN